MPNIIIAANGDTKQAQANARGHLFEEMMSNVLRQHGYKIDSIPSRNYSGMEIDIVGHHELTKVPLYCECKCYANAIDAPKFQAFVGKYMTLWLKNNRANGLFISIPGVNSHVKAFYSENYKNRSDTQLQILDEDDVLNTILRKRKLPPPETIANLIDSEIGTVGDQQLLYCELGFFWIQFIVPRGSGIVGKFAVFNSSSELVQDRATLEHIRAIQPDLNSFRLVEKLGTDHLVATSAEVSIKDAEEIVEVRGSSECFEYQFPASPEHFVGRDKLISEVKTFADAVRDSETTSRGLHLVGYSGFGKSSIVLESVSRLNAGGDFAVAIDSRSASSSQFILRVVQHAIAKFSADFNLSSHDLDSCQVTGFDGATELMLSIGQQLKLQNKVLVIFLDQFENVFFLPEALKRITSLLLKLCDSQVNVAIAFSWKTDLISLTSEFPYIERDKIVSSSKRITIDAFSDIETTELLTRLSKEMGAKLRKDLAFLLSEFSQGYPWLLKKLCAHVKSLRESGVAQIEIADSFLNVEELFQSDLSVLNAEQESTLRRIARLAPISVQALGEDFDPAIVQSLVNERLIVRIGSKYDVYWDIFRDYLNFGKLPVQENYILHIAPSSVTNTVRLLANSSSTMTIEDVLRVSGLSEKSFYNVARDIKLLGIASIDNGRVVLTKEIPSDEREFENSFRQHIKEKLPKNRLVSRLMARLESEESVSLDEVASLISSWCPYISATEKTWKVYARIFALWMDFAYLAIFDTTTNLLSSYKPGSEIRSEGMIFARKRGTRTIPLIQTASVEKIISTIAHALEEEVPVDWSVCSRSTVSKSLATLEDLGFIKRKRGSISVSRKLRIFADDPGSRVLLFRSGLLELPVFNTFIEILREHSNDDLSVSEIGILLNERLGGSWSESTCHSHAKMLLNWARYVQLVPSSYLKIRKGKRNQPNQ